MARIDGRVERLVRRARRGDIAIVNHLDLDRVSAEALAERGVVAVVNATTSISGRYPSLGPSVLLTAGIPLVDQVGPDVFGRVRDGDRLRLHGGALYRGQVEVARGFELTADLVERATIRARAGLSAQLEAFAANTAEYLRRRSDLLLDGAGMPETRTVLRGRHVLVVARGYGYRKDLSRLRPYIREYGPVLVGVDGGADALLEARYRPDLIVCTPGDGRTAGDPGHSPGHGLAIAGPSSVSERALRCGAELVVPALPDGAAPPLDRLVRLGLEAVVVPATGTSEDTAVLLADAKGAELIVLAGAARTLVELLDKGREGMAGGFLTRVRAGRRLADAGVVGRLTRPRVRARHLAMPLLAGLLALLTALATTAAVSGRLETFGVELAEVLSGIRRLLP